MSFVLILTGTCGSGKTTISMLLAKDFGWQRIAEDDIGRPIWEEPRPLPNGGAPTQASSSSCGCICRYSRGRRAHQNVVVDATVHEMPPAAYLEYKAFFDTHTIAWRLCILHPRVEVAIARDSQRFDWVAGGQRVRVRAKFTGAVFAHEWFIDNSKRLLNKRSNA